MHPSSADSTDSADTPALRQALSQALSQHPVLSQLDDDSRAALAAELRLQRITPGSPVADGDALTRELGLVVEGQVLWRTDDGARGPALPVPAWFGAGVNAHTTGWRLQVDDSAPAPALIAWADASVLAALLARQPWLQLFLQRPATQAASADADPADPHLNLMRTPVRELIKRSPITLPTSTPIRAAAQLMREQRVSSVLLVDDGQLRGMVTDRDLRNRVVAEGLDTTRPVRDIATETLLTMQISQPGFEALLMMARHNIHHVPVMDGHTVAGMITATDVTEQHSTSAVFLAGDIHKQTSLDGLVACAGKVRLLQRHLAAAGASAYATGHIVSAITDALTTRLLQLGEAQLGPAPVAYAWLAAGSQARSEQTAKSDQDNGMILDDAYDEATHGAYFKALATYVCDGLNACGYVYCPGEMMAMTAQWRQPRRVWAEYFRKWIDTPEPMALMLTCVFFDVRTVAGDPALLNGLRAEVLQQTRQAKLFLAHMVGNALTHQPPTSLMGGVFGHLFGGLPTIRSGEHKGTIDLKHNGIVPVIDLARVYALAAGDDAVNTHDRLAHAAESGEISPQSGRDLRDALEFLSALRIRHQARQIAAGTAADNFLNPEALSNFEREQLKDAFGVIRQLQEVLAQRYPGLRR